MKMITVRQLKQGDYFTLKPYPEPRETQVYVRGEYDRATKTFCCNRFDDISFCRNFKPDRVVYVDFDF